MATSEARPWPGPVALAFRGYNTTNLGRSQELLAHPVYGPTVRSTLLRASHVASDCVHRRIDLVERVEAGQETDLASFEDAVALVLAMEVAQLRLAETYFGLRWDTAKLSFGYSLGEIGALIAGGVFAWEDALRIPLAVAADCAALAEGATMGVVFARRAPLDLRQIERLCLEINQRGHGVIGISAQLAPNTVLVMGQGDTVDRLGDGLVASSARQIHLRKNHEQWPPLHTPLVWQRHIPNRAAELMHTLPGGLVAPHPPVLSLVTGKKSYTATNCRDLLHQWIDHPQRLWDAVYATLSSGIETVVHIGPAPNLIPATFRRLADNVLATANSGRLNSLGVRAIAGLVRRPWLGQVLPSQAALARAPYMQHIVLEDWLLAQTLEDSGAHGRTNGASTRTGAV
ncbi:MAG: hypothetical protein U0836_02175 [Pirellulales bacterium]